MGSDATRGSRRDGCPVELWLGAEKIEVWLDAGGIRFRQPKRTGGASEGVLPWDVALALALVPDEWRAKRPAA